MALSSYLLRILNPSNLIKLHRYFLFKRSAKVGAGLRVTHRSELFAHKASRHQIQIGAHALIDGTIEVYEKGVLSIGDHVFVGRSRIYCSNKVTIGKNVLVSDNVAIMDSDLHPRSASKRELVATQWARGHFPDVYADVPSAGVVLGDHCWLGFGCVVLKGVSIGEGAIIGAGSVVSSDIPAWTIAAGNPAKVIQDIKQVDR